MIADNLVDHPSHYNTPGRKECIVEMEDSYGPYITAIFCLTNAYKYLYRAGEKDGNPAAQDNDKAIWYFNYAKKLTNSGINLWGNGLNLYNYIKEELTNED